MRLVSWMGVHEGNGYMHCGWWDEGRRYIACGRCTISAFYQPELLEQRVILPLYVSVELGRFVA